MCFCIQIPLVQNLPSVFMLRLSFLGSIFFFTFCSVYSLNAVATLEGNADPILLSDTFQSENITGRTDFLIDSGFSLSLEDVLELNFTKSHQTQYRLGFSPNAIWITFSLHNDSEISRKFILQATNWFIDEADLYRTDDSGIWQIERAGDLIPFSQRSVKSKYPGFQIRLAADETKTFYLRIRNTQYNQFSLNLIESEYFFQFKESGDSKELITGLILMRFAFHLSLLIFLYRDKKLRVFSYWGIFLCAVYYFSSGFSGFLFPNSPFLTNKAFYFVVSFAPMALSYYIYTIFELKKYIRWIRIVYGGLIVIGLINLILTFFVHHWLLSWGYIVFMALMISFHLISCIYFYFKFSKPSFWYVSTLILYLPAFSFYYLRNAGLITSDLEFNIIQFTFFLDFLTVSFITAAQLKLRKSENVQLQESVYLKQREARQLAEMDELKTRFFTNVSHEFRTPLSLLVAPLSDLKDKYPHEKIIDLMRRNVLRLQSLINQLLDLSKLNAGHLKINEQKGDIAEFVAQITLAFQNFDPDKNIKFTAEQSHSQFLAVFDSDKLDKIVVNLLSNAFKFTPPNGSVDFRATIFEDRIEISISDTGVGISRENVSRIFDRFYQVDENSGKSFGGTGIGLALVKELVEVLNGSIEVNTELNKGSSFFVSIPLKAIQSEQESEQHLNNHMAIPLYNVNSGASDGAENEHQNKPVVLIVEDNVDLRAYLQQILSREYRVLTAYDGNSGVEIALEQCPDLIITDVMMPGMDGYQLSTILKKDIRTSHIPIIMLTAKTAEPARIDGLMAGADIYLTKPFNSQELQLSLGNLLEARKKLQLFYTHNISDISGKVSDNLSVDEFDPDLQFMKNMNQYFEKAFSQSELTLEDLCRQAGMGKTHLSGKFKALTAMSPMQFLRDFRLHKAKTMLGNHKLTIAEVAYSCGFNDAKYFSRQFAQTYGILPSQFREDKRYI